MLKANLQETNTYTGAELEKLLRALELLEVTINGDKFKTAVLNFQSFQFVKYKCFLGIRVRTFQLKKYTNAEVYQKIMEGHRSIGNETFMDLKLEVSSADGGTAIGATNGSNVTTTYRAAFNRMSEAQLAAHIAHEWTHTLGFEHSFSNKCGLHQRLFIGAIRYR